MPNIIHLFLLVLLLPSPSLFPHRAAPSRARVSASTRPVGRRPPKTCICLQIMFMLETFHFRRKVIVIKSRREAAVGKARDWSFPNKPLPGSKLEFADPHKVLEIHQIQQRSTPRSKDPPNPTIKPVPIATTVMFKKKKMILLIFHLMPDGFHHHLLPDGLHHLNLSPDGVDHGLLRVQSLAGHPSPCQVAKLLQKSKLRKSQIISRS